jgi:hypothetical protein
LGVAAFVLSLVVVLAGFAFFAVSGYIAVKTRGGSPEAVEHGRTVFGVYLLTLFVATLAAMSLGLASLFAKGSKRVFGALGMGFSGFTLVCFGGVAFVGVSVRAANRGPNSAGATWASPAPPPVPNSARSSGPWMGLPVFQIAANDNTQVVVGTVEGATIETEALGRLGKAIGQKITDQKMENVPTGLAKQFLIEVGVKKSGAVESGTPGLMALNLVVDVRILPGGERVSHFEVGELGGPEVPEKTLELKAANDTVKCINDPRMWVRPEPRPAPAAAAAPGPAGTSHGTKTI